MADLHIVFEPGWELRALAASSSTVDEVTEAIAEDMRRYAPVDTGALRDSIEAEPAVEGSGRVRVGTDHWQFPEYGTRDQDAQPYARPALYQERG